MSFYYDSAYDCFQQLWLGRRVALLDTEFLFYDFADVHTLLPSLSSPGGIDIWNRIINKTLYTTLKSMMSNNIM